jgi:methylthioribose-1-phosphate isomerase
VLNFPRNISAGLSEQVVGSPRCLDSQKPMRTVSWDDARNLIVLIDQRLLPGRFELFSCATAKETAAAIREMVVRGAPAIGVTAAFGLAVEAAHSLAATPAGLLDELTQAETVLRASRPTAVNLFWALERMMQIARRPYVSVGEMRTSLLDEAQRMAQEDIEINRRMASLGAALIDDGDTLIHHCNTGALAAVDWGTALGCIRMAHEQGKHIHVLVDETRPRLQGSRLTAWELSQWGISYEIISDNMAGYFLRKGEATKVFFGADRVAANGDVANKIGSYMLALAANHNDVPVYAVMPASTVDLSLASGDLIPIEERDPAEVLNLSIHGETVSPAGSKARNPAFDVTPHQLITALVTDRGVIYPPFKPHLALALAA